MPRPVKSVYQNLSLAICSALLKEETNSQYLTSQSQILLYYVDEHQNMNENTSKYSNNNLSLKPSKK